MSNANELYIENSIKFNNAVNLLNARGYAVIHIDDWLDKNHLNVQLDAANKRIAELEQAWLQGETIDVDGKLRPSVVDLINDRDVARQKLHEAEEKLAVASAEMESMHNELQAKQDEIDEQKRELAEVKAEIKLLRALDDRLSDDGKKRCKYCGGILPFHVVECRSF